MTTVNEIFEFLKAQPDVANAVAAVAGVMIASLAFVASIISLFVSVRALKHQQRHNTLSIRPLPEVTVADYEDSLRVKLRNNGSGPLIVKSLAASDGVTTRDALIDCMPELPRGHWTHFCHALVDRSLLPGSEIVLLELTADEREKDFHKSRDIARAALAPITVTVNYSDVYGSALPAYKKTLSWFGRHK